MHQQNLLATVGRQSAQLSGFDIGQREIRMSLTNLRPVIGLCDRRICLTNDQESCGEYGVHLRILMGRQCEGVTAPLMVALRIGPSGKLDYNLQKIRNRYPV